jgi:hypothetical protein
VTGSAPERAYRREKKSLALAEKLSTISRLSSSQHSHYADRPITAPNKIIKKKNENYRNKTTKLQK